MNKRELEVMRNSGIYRIVHLASGREYIGQSQNIFDRWHQHRWALRKGKHHSRHLQSAWLKYGEADFSFEIVSLCEINELDNQEQNFLNDRQPAFNVAPWAGTCRGVRHSEEARRRMGAPKKGKKLSAEHREKISRAGIGRKHSPEAIENMRAAARIRGMSPEIRAKGQAASKALKRSPETREKISAANVGKKLSPEHRSKISAALSGRKISDEHKAKLSAAKIGKPWTDARRNSGKGNNQ